MTPCTDRKHQAMKDDGYAKCWDCGESFYAERKPPVVASNDLLGEESHKPSGWNPDYVDRHELLVHISKRHKEWIEDAQGRKTDLVRGISIGNAMALEELHGWVKAWTPNPAVRGREPASVPCTGVVRPEIQKETDNGK